MKNRTPVQRAVDLALIAFAVGMFVVGCVLASQLAVGEHDQPATPVIVQTPEPTESAPVTAA